MAGKRNSLGPAVIYVVTNLLNGNFYVGVTSRELNLRLREHVSVALAGKVNGRLSRAIRKYGGEHFSIQPLKVCATLGDGMSEEIRLIALLNPPYNSTKGGDGQLGRTLSAEARRRIGAASKGRKARLGIPTPPGAKLTLSKIGKQPENLARFAQYSHLGPRVQMRAVVCLDDQQTFESASAAARAYSAPKSLVIQVCNNDQHRKTAKGLRFKYLDSI